MSAIRRIRIKKGRKIAAARLEEKKILDRDHQTRFVTEDQLKENPWFKDKDALKGQRK